MSGGNWAKIRDPRDRFLAIPNEVVRDAQLTPAAFRVMCYVLANRSDWQVSQTSIGRALDMDPGTVRRGLVLLEELGYLKRIQQHSAAGRQPDMLVFSHERLTADEWDKELAALSLIEETPTGVLPDGVLPDGKMPVRKKTNSKKTILKEDHQDSSSSGDDGVLPGMPEPTPPNHDVDAEFEDWWKSYPRKVGKDAARIKYRAARKGGASEQALADALAAHAAGWERERRAKEYVPHAATWLNQGRYADEDLPGTGTAERATNTRYDGAYWAGQQTEERDENGYTAEDRLMMERHGVTISYGHGK